jgi:hypothetical protein
MQTVEGPFLAASSMYLLQINVSETFHIGPGALWGGFYPFYPFTIFLNG